MVKYELLELKDEKSSLMGFLCVTAGAVTAQVEVKVNPIGVLIGQAGVGIEYLAGENEVIGIEALASYKFPIESALFTTLVAESTGFEVVVQPKLYFQNGQGWDGFYFAPYVVYINRQSTYEGDPITYNALGGGVAAGYKMVTEPGLLFDAGAGIGRNFQSAYSDPEIDSNEDLFLPFNFIARVSIGFRLYECVGLRLQRPVGNERSERPTGPSGLNLPVRDCAQTGTAIHLPRSKRPQPFQVVRGADRRPLGTDFLHSTEPELAKSHWRFDDSEGGL